MRDPFKGLPAADVKVLRSLKRRFLAERKRRLAQEHKNFLQAASLSAKALATIKKSDRVELVRKWELTRRTTRNLAAQARRPAFRPLSGHNPARYAPFDFTLSGSEGQGSVTFYGPSASSGEIGAIVNGRERGGASAFVSVALWYYAGAGARPLLSPGTLLLSAQATVGGAAEVGSYVGTLPTTSTNPDTFGTLSFGMAYAGLKAYVVSAYGLQTGTADITGGTMSAPGQTTFMNWEARTVMVATPLKPETWYLIIVEAVISAANWASADFRMFVGPVAYTVV